MSEPEATLALAAVRKSYGGPTGPLAVLDGCDVYVRPGETVALLGPSGSGKSTLLHVAGLLDAPDDGEVRLEGRDVTRLNDRARTRLRRTRFGFVYQFHHLLPELSALENVAMPLRVAGEGKKAARARARELLVSLGLETRLDHRPAALSGGERQRAAIARALVGRPAVLLADEPTGNLDPTTSRQVADALISAAKEQGAAALVATHDMDLARRLDRVVRLAEGRVVDAAS